MMGRAGAAFLCTAREMYGSARTVIDDPADGFWTRVIEPQGARG